jgi:hypothetical protein
LLWTIFFNTKINVTEWPNFASINLSSEVVILTCHIISNKMSLPFTMSFSFTLWHWHTYRYFTEQDKSSKWQLELNKVLRY